MGFEQSAEEAVPLVRAPTMSEKGQGRHLADSATWPLTIRLRKCRLLSHAATLPNRLGQYCTDCRLEPLMMVRNDGLGAEHLAPVFPVGANRDQRRLALDHAGLADAVVASIKIR
jgi:hypothetical protein